MEPTPEERIELLEQMLSAVTDLLHTVHARSLAMQHLLDELGILGFGDVETRKQRMIEQSDEAFELSPEYEQFRRWRREREGHGDAPDDVKP